MPPCGMFICTRHCSWYEHLTWGKLRPSETIPLAPGHTACGGGGWGEAFPLRPPPPQSPTKLGALPPHRPRLVRLLLARFAKCNRWPGQQTGANLGKNCSLREKLEPWLSFLEGCEKSQERAGLRGRQGRKRGRDPYGPLRIAGASPPRLQKQLQLEL